MDGHVTVAGPGLQRGQVAESGGAGSHVEGLSPSVVGSL